MDRTHGTRFYSPSGILANPTLEVLSGPFREDPATEVSCSTGRGFSCVGDGVVGHGVV